MEPGGSGMKCEKCGSEIRIATLIREDRIKHADPKVEATGPSASWRITELFFNCPHCGGSNTLTKDWTLSNDLDHDRGSNQFLDGTHNHI